MDDESSVQFDAMAKCVVAQYSKYEVTPGVFIDGCLTQSENIADIGGLHAAFAAFNTHRALVGPDPQLPDRLYRNFDHDQLFFVNYAQTWCSAPLSAAYIEWELPVAEHAPAKYRVMGVLSDVVGFRNAFRCPVHTVYAPASHCEVWVTESKIGE